MLIANEGKQYIKDLCGDKLFENKSQKAKAVIKAFFDLPFNE